MNRRLGTSVVLTGLLGMSLSRANMADALGGTIEGTVNATGLASNAEAVVSIQQASGTFAPSTTPAVMDQRKMQFNPRVLPIVIGTTVRFLNSDSIRHGVFSPDYEKYNLGSWTQGETKDRSFALCKKVPCVYVQLCRFHPEMDGYVVVLQNPFFATTDRDGHYKIENVPTGAYSLAVWHEKQKAQPKPVTVDAGKSAFVDFVLGP